MIRTFTSLIVAVALAVPALAEAQAIPRGSSSSGSSSGSSGGGSSSSSSSGGSSGGAEARVSPPSGGDRTYSRQPVNSPSRTGSSTAKAAPAPGGISGGSSSGSASSRTGATTSVLVSDTGYMRVRGGQPVVGTAGPRPAVDYISFPFFGNWGFWYPWYGGFGWDMRFVGYNPWYYGATRWYWGPYGLWYDPFTYDPYYFGSGYGRYSDYGRNREEEEKEPETMGSLRIKANLSSAKVYIDNALVGLVEEFDGLNSHLEIEGGRHSLEIRADGYVTHKQDINVKVGTTQTIRVKLKAKK